VPPLTPARAFGAADSYVAEVKGALLSRLPHVTIVDISHEIPPGNVRAGQYLLSRAWRQFPEGTVHLAIVDPGVGTERPILAADSSGHRFVAPDNGLLSFLPEGTRFVSMPIPAGAAPTFHGRDVVAPAATSLANGATLASLGAAITHPHRAPLPTPYLDRAAAVGEVIYVDHFGTLISNIPRSAMKPGARIRVAGIEVGTLRRTFAEPRPS